MQMRSSAPHLFESLSWVVRFCKLYERTIATTSIWRVLVFFRLVKRKKDLTRVQRRWLQHRCECLGSQLHALEQTGSFWKIAGDIRARDNKKANNNLLLNEIAYWKWYDYYQKIITIAQTDEQGIWQHSSSINSRLKQQKEVTCNRNV